MNLDRFILTDLGIAARQDVLANGKTIAFTRANLGKGKPNIEDEIPAMTGMFAPDFDVPIARSTAKSNTHDISIVIDNQEPGPFDEPYSFSEVGVFAQIDGEDEILYAYSYSDVPITLHSKKNPYVTQILTTTTISRASNANIIIDDSLAYLTHADGAGLQEQIDYQHRQIMALQGNAGYLTHHDFGSPDPTPRDLFEYACQQIWGEGGAFNWQATYPFDSTYTIDGATHSVTEIFNATRVQNDNDGNTWELVNDLSHNVFEWINIGAAKIATATKDTAGVVKSDNPASVNANFVVDSLGNVTFPNFGRTFVSATRPTGLKRNDRWIEIVT